MNPYLLEKMLEERRGEMLEEAARLQLLAAYNAHSPSRRSRLFTALGVYLVATGERLIERNSCRVEIGNTDTTAQA